jgi:NitT/TauT family transport system substrate-binding protein
MLSQEPLLIAQDQGIRSKIIATILGNRVYGIIARPEITNLSDLKGAAVYAADPGSAPYTFTCNVLKEAGLDPAKDVTFIQMDIDAAIMALENGGIKAAFINMNKVPELKGMKVNILVDATQEADCQKYLGNTEFPAEMFCTTEDYAKKHPEICQKVVNAIINAQTWIQEHTDKEVAESVSKHLTAIDLNILAEEIAIMRNVYKPDCFISPEGENAVVKMCLKTGLISRAMPYDEIVDMSFVNNYKKSN